MTLKVAVVHDWLVTYAGAEKVLEQILACYPQADLFSVIDFLDDAARAKLGGKHAKTTFIQRLPWAKTKYRTYLPLMPIAIEQLDLSGYDVVISSSHAVAKGVITGPDQTHVCYIHSPIRYAWDLQHQYLKESHLEKGVMSILARFILHKIRIWDIRSAHGVDVFVSNSKFISRRVKKFYGRKSSVIYPPVDTDNFTIEKNKKDYFLTASRMVPYKKIPMIIEAFSLLPDKQLVVIGDGPEMENVKSKAGKNIHILGYQPFDVLRQHMQDARAFVFAAEEDFGIVPVEAQACGTPVIAFGRGGAVETVVTGEQNPTGVLFEEQTAESLAAAIEAFDAKRLSFLPENCRRNAERFSISAFKHNLINAINEAIATRSINPSSD
ncbi:glycosyltransferase family 4 protein [Solimonas marina]|uniref:Glycosyltransferase family 4 protein n=1 Tax=Solimonas marina TaxID=2714601 RepID=A0A969W741_9GAMM|nr:glycosyltransferase family 4 protein [Solimonas marina]NKF21896.1 glycosyltransferase family 4 protein [Solimonas marina]